MTNVMRSGAFDTPADEIWRIIGDFHALGDWHPAVVKQTAEGDKRHLEIPGGAVIVEQLLGTDTHSYAYAILSGPLPVENYRSTLSVAPAGPTSSVVVWTSTFDATADGADGAVAGIYEAGLAALRDRLGG